MEPSKENLRAPPEWYPLFVTWVEEQQLQPEQKQAMLDAFSEYMFRLEGNLYGRRTAGQCTEMSSRTSCAPSFVLSLSSREECMMLVFSVANGQASRWCTMLMMCGALDRRPCSTISLRRQSRDCEIQAGPLEVEGTAVEVLGRVKTRLNGAILTAPDSKHADNIIRTINIGPKERSGVPSKKADLNNTELLNAEMAGRFRSAVGSGIYLSADRRDIAVGVKELARHMSAPRKCEGDGAVILARYLQAHPEYVRVVALDEEAWACEGKLRIDVYSDSDWLSRNATEH